MDKREVGKVESIWKDGDYLIALPYEDYLEIIKSQITLRDFFAGCALSGMVVNEFNFCAGEKQYVEKAFKFADAMLGERGK